MKRIAILVAMVLCLAGSAWGQIVRNATSSVTPEDSLPPIHIQLWDSAGYNAVSIDSTLDSAYIVIYSPNGDSVYGDNFALDVSTEGGKVKLTRRYGSVAEATYTDQISNLDGTVARNGTYSYIVVARDSSLKLSNPPFGIRGTFQLYISTTHTFAANQDSVSYVSSYKADAITAAAIATDAIGALEIAAAAIGTAEFAAETDIVSSGAITTSGGVVANVNSVLLDVSGKVLGGGATTIIGTGVEANIKASDTVALATTTTTVTNDVGIKADDTVLYVRHVDTVLQANNVNIKASDTVALATTTTSVTNDVGIKTDDTVLYVRHTDTVMQANQVNIKASDTVALVTTTTTVTNDVGIKTDDTVLYVRHTDTVLYVSVTGTANQANIKTDDTVLYVRHVDTVIYGVTVGAANSVNIKPDDTILYVRHVDTVIYAVTVGTANQVNIKADDTVLYVRHVDTAMVSGAAGGNDSLQVRRWVWHPNQALFGGYYRVVDSNKTEGVSGSYAQTLSITVLDTSGTDAVVPYVTVTVQNLAQTANLNTAASAATGIATMGIPSASTAIAIVAALPGYVFPVFKDTTGSGATFSDTVRGYNVAIDAPTVTNLCRLSGYVYTSFGTVVTNALVKVCPDQSRAGKSGTTIVVPRCKAVPTNSSGLFTIDVIMSDSLHYPSADSTFLYNIEVAVPSEDQPGVYDWIPVKERVLIPNSATYEVQLYLLQGGP